MILSATVSQQKTAFAPILFSGDALGGIDQAARIGFPAVELHLRRPSDLDLPALRARLAERKMALSSVGTGLSYVDDRLTFTSEDASVRRSAVERVLEVIEAFSAAKPLIIIGTIKGKLSEARNRETAVGRMRDALQECCPRARAHGMTLTLEAICRYEQDFLHTVAEVAAFIDTLKLDNLKAHVDTFHMNIEEQSVESSLVRYRDYIGHVHLADSNRRYPGSGHIDFASVFRTLDAVGYQGHLAVECLPLPSPAEAAARSFSYVSGILGTLKE